MTTKKVERRIKIKYRIRKNVFGTAERPRLSVFRSNKQIYAQLSDFTAFFLASNEIWIVSPVASFFPETVLSFLT